MRFLLDSKYASEVSKYWGLAVACAAALTMTACSDSAAKNADGDMTVTAVIDGQTVRLDKPAGRTKGLALWFHGQGGDSDTRMNEDWLNALRVNGWAVASSDLHGNAWGNHAAVTDTAALLAWAKAETGQPENLMFVAGSMGALNSLTYMAGPGEDPGCWYGTMPVVDATQVSGVKDAEAQIDAAHGGKTPAPIPFHQLPDAKYRVLASPLDTWVPAAYHADVLTAALQTNKREVSTLTVSGEHGHPSHFRAQDLAEFSKQCLS